VIEDRDTEISRQALAWARGEGRLTEKTAELEAALELTDAAIEALVEERNRARRQREFARADAIRNQLAEKGILLEDSRDGVRWRRR